MATHNNKWSHMPRATNAIRQVWYDLPDVAAGTFGPWETLVLPDYVTSVYLTSVAVAGDSTSFDFYLYNRRMGTSKIHQVAVYTNENEYFRDINLWLAVTNMKATGSTNELYCRVQNNSAAPMTGIILELTYYGAKEEQGE